MIQSTLNQLCRIRTGKVDVNSGNPDGKYPFFTCARDFTFSDEFDFDCEAILIAGNGEVGLSHYFNGKFQAYQRTYVLDDFRDVFVPYLKYVIDANLIPHLKGLTHGSSIPYIRIGGLESCPVPLPPLQEQKRIAGILDEADRVRKKTQALIDKYDELAQSLFLDMFGDPVTNPKGWEVKPLGSVIELVNGRAYKKDELLNEGTPVLRIQNLNGGQRWYFSDLDLPQSKYCHKGDLLFAWSASFGPYIFDGPKSIFHYHIWNCRIEKKAQIPFYFGLLKQLTDQIKSNSHGASMLHMTKGGMEQMEIIVPPDSVIAEFTELREKNATQRQGLIIEVSRAESLFNALLQKAFKGELN